MMSSLPTATNAHSDEETARCDCGFYGIIGLVVVVTGWLLLMPFVDSIRSTTMNRFHLRTGTFWQWAIQQPIPSMYNFANRVRVTRRDPATGRTSVVFQRPVNHFPVQAVTFATGRYRCLRDGQPCQVHATSTYRGEVLETRFDVTSNGDETFLMTRVIANERGDDG